MRTFFDNCTSPIYAGVINALLEPEGGAARHIRFMPEYGFDGATTDIAWIERLASDRPADWTVITGDDTIRRNKAERAMWKRSGLKGFVLSRRFQKLPVHQCASIILWRWREIEQFISLAAGGSLFELPVNRGSKFVALSV